MTLGDVIFGCFAIFMVSITAIIIFAPRENLYDDNEKKKTKKNK